MVALLLDLGTHFTLYFMYHGYRAYSKILYCNASVRLVGRSQRQAPAST